MMLNRNLLNLCVLLVVIGIHQVRSLDYLTEKPEFLQPCRIHQPGFTECFTDNKQKLVDLLTSGVPEIVQLFGSFDPIRFPKEDFRSNDLNVTLWNITLFGFKNTTIKEERVNPVDFSKQTKMFVFRARLEANYELRGMLNELPLSGAGDVFMEFENLDLKLDTTTRLYEKGGFTFFNVTHVGVELNATRVRSHFDNLSVWNLKAPAVSIVLNMIINRKWQDFLGAARPMIKQIFERVALDLEQRFFHFIPANFFIEDIPTSDQLYY